MHLKVGGEYLGTFLEEAVAPLSLANSPRVSCDVAQACEKLPLAFLAQLPDIAASARGPPLVSSRPRGVGFSVSRQLLRCAEADFVGA